MNPEKRLFTNSELEEIRKMRLIAAAPELLAALESLISDFRTTTRDCYKWSGYAAAVQAIAKAKGVSYE